jgi:hypothetical protein
MGLVVLDTARAGDSRPRITVIQPHQLPLLMGRGLVALELVWVVSRRPRAMATQPQYGTGPVYTCPLLASGVVDEASLVIVLVQ